MDTNHLILLTFINLAISAISLFLFCKVLFSRFMLLRDLYLKLKGIGSRASTPNLPLANLDHEVGEINTGASSGGQDYDVFLSFRGDDTRNNFVSHLYKELKVKGIHTFKDDKELARSKSITPALREAIDKSQIAIVVLSQNYAFSSWCLDELVKIVECEKTKQQIVLPIFYKVDPSDVDKQTGPLAKAFEEHQKNFDVGDVQKWRNALSRVAAIAGWESQKCFDGNEASLIECIVRDVSDKLICINSSYAIDLVGIDSHTMRMDKLLDYKCNDVRMVGIWGFGGIGKSTIAGFIYHRDSNKFDARYYLKDIKDKYKKEGAIALQKELLSQILCSSFDLNICTTDMGSNLLQRRLCNKRVIIVLDDVDNMEQLRALANSTNWFGIGSRIIITTRDRHVLVAHQVNYIYEVQTLNPDESLQLFCRHAFKQNQPRKDFLKLSKELVTYTHGLPLVSIVLGTFLYGMEKKVWKSELDKLKRIPNANVYHVLRISYDNLDDDFFKDVFLDIAFFFNGEDELSVRNVLEQCCLYPSRAFGVLKDKAMLTILNNRLYIHDLLRQVAYEIVREQSKDPRNRSRLCDPNDIRFVLTNKKDVSAIEGISLDISMIKSIYLKPDAFVGLDRLRILKFYGSYSEHQLHLLGGLHFLPNELKSLHWRYFPAKSLPSSFTGENLVELSIRESQLEHLWQGEAELPSLRVLDLAENEFLKTLPNLSTSTNIEAIKLSFCESLIDFSFDLEDHLELKSLDLRCCRKLRNLPKLPVNLEVLNAAGCRSLIALPTEIKTMESLKALYFSSSAVKEFPASVTSIKSLVRLAVTAESMSEIPQSICKLRNLQTLILKSVPVNELPECITELKSLKTLRLYDVAITKLPEFIVHMQLQELLLQECEKLVSLPNCLNEFSSLVQLDMLGCISVCSLPELPSSLIHFKAINCESLQMMPTDDQSHLQNLHHLSLVNCKKLDHKAYREFLEHLQRLILRTKVFPRSYNDRFSRASLPYTYLVPGNEVPDWFHYQSCGSSVTTKVPSYSHQFRGVAYCFVYGPKYHQKFTDDDMDYHCTSSCYVIANNYYMDMCDFAWYPNCGDHVVVSVHFIEQDCVANFLGCDVRFDFRLGFEGEVKKCGIYYIPDGEGEK